jgi:hypothetical protein
MAQTIIPTVGATIAAADTAAQNKANVCNSAFVVSGYSLSDGGTLNVDVAAGSAMINGYLITDTAATTGNALTNTATNYVYLLVDGTITVNTTGTNPGNAILLGKVVTAGGVVSSISHLVNITSGKDIAIYKSADEVRESTVTIVDDTDLIFAVLARQAWEFTFRLKILSPASGGDFRFDISIPSGAYYLHDLIFAPNGGGTPVQLNFPGGEVVLQTSGNEDYLKITGIVWVGATAGNIALEWAQGTSNATGARVKAGSILTARRIYG